jgi:hypothetical protein
MDVFSSAASDSISYNQTSADRLRSGDRAVEHGREWMSLSEEPRTGRQKHLMPHLNAATDSEFRVENHCAGRTDEADQWPGMVRIHHHISGKMNFDH